MSVFSFLCSCTAFAAIAIDPKSARLSWLKRFLSAKTRKAPLASAPTLTRDAGWSLIHCDDEEAFRRWLGQDQEGFPQGPDDEPSLGSHLLIELYGCDRNMLEEESTVGDAMREAADRSEATTVATSFHEFQPFGVSGAVIIQESHYTIHTWPEHGYAAVDLFYCGGTVKVNKAVEVLRERFQPVRIKFLVVRRGLRSEVAR